jgi:hypothetical protein
MMLEHDDLPVPAVYRQQHQPGKQAVRAGGDGQLHAIRGHHFADLLGGALVQMQLDLRIALAERVHHRRQYIARLGVRGRDRERAAIVLVQVGGHGLEAVDLGQRAIGVLEHFGALRRHAGERPALAHEQIEAELALERLERAADRGLRRAQRRGGLGHRQPWRAMATAYCSWWKFMVPHHTAKGAGQSRLNHNNTLLKNGLCLSIRRQRIRVLGPTQTCPASQ